MLMKKGIGKVFYFYTNFYNMFLSKLVPSFFYLILICCFSMEAVSQSDCKVKMEELEGSYEGDCKKGLAHGKGTAEGTDTYSGEFRKGLPHGNGVYTWKDGMSYDGEFRNGVKHGEGKMMISIINQEDSVLTGFWNNDVYVGKYKEPYKIYDKTSLVTGTSVEKAEGEEFVIYVTIKLKGKTQSNAKFDLREQVGNYSQIQPFGRVTKVYVVRFPFRFVLSYMEELVEIEIFNEGSWNLAIDINK